MGPHPTSMTVHRWGARALGERLIFVIAVLAATLFGAFAVNYTKIAVLVTVAFSFAAIWFRTYTAFERRLLTAMILVSATADIPRRFNFGPITGLGALSVLFLLATLPFWLYHPSVVRRVPRALAGFLIWIVVVSSILTPSKIGIQNIVVYVLFVSTLVISSVVTESDVRFGVDADRALLAAGWLGTALYGLSALTGGLGGGTIIGSRSYALF